MMTRQDFPDRRGLMFGRGPDVDYILSRVKSKGLSAIVARPKMGKTWLLIEVGRRLTETEYLVGYHECLGEPDQMLRVVSDLYTRWLQASDKMQQAQSLWERHKDSLVSKSGLAVGNLFATLANIGSSGMFW